MKTNFVSFLIDYLNSNPIFKRFARIESGRRKIRSIRERERFQFQFLNLLCYPSLDRRRMVVDYSIKARSTRRWSVSFFFFKWLRKYSSRVVAGYKAALSPRYRKGRYKKGGKEDGEDARYSGSGSIVEGRKRGSGGRERVVIQDLFSQTVTAGLVLLARFKGYRIPHRFCNTCH